jgi:hypothetical protein
MLALLRQERFQNSGLITSETNAIRLRLFKMSRNQFCHLKHANLTFAVEDFPQRFVGIYHGSLFLILATVLLNVVPEFFRQLRAREWS